jgi:hypothetical protein
MWFNSTSHFQIGFNKMDLNNPIIQNNLQQASYGIDFISFLDSSCINSIQRKGDTDYYAVYGNGNRLFTEYTCLKLGDIWPALEQRTFLFITSGVNFNIHGLVNARNIICVMGNTVYFNDNSRFKIDSCSVSEMQEFAKSVIRLKNLL